MFVLLLGVTFILLSTWWVRGLVERENQQVRHLQAQALADHLEYHLKGLQASLALFAARMGQTSPDNVAALRELAQKYPFNPDGGSAFERLSLVSDVSGNTSVANIVAAPEHDSGHIVWITHTLDGGHRLLAGMDLAAWRQHAELASGTLLVRISTVGAYGTRQTLLDEAPSGTAQNLLLSKVIQSTANAEWALDIWQNDVQVGTGSVFGWLQIIQLAALLVLVGLMWIQGKVQQTAHDEVKRVSLDAELNRDRWMRALEATHDGVWEYDLAHKALFVAPICFELACLPAGAKKPLWAFLRLLGREQRSRMVSALRAAWDEASRLDELVWIQGAGGNKRWLRIRGRVAPNRSYVTGAISDVTEEIELARERDRYQSFMAGVIDALPMPISVKGVDGALILVNKLHAQSLHKMIGELIGKRANQLVDSRMAEQLEMIDRLVLETGLTHSLEDWFDIALAGRRVFLRVTKSRCLDENGKAVIVTTYEDQTEVRSYARRLADQNVKVQSFVQRLIETIPHPLYVQDDESRYLIVNAAMADQWGMRAEDMVGRSSRELFGNERGASLEEEDRKVMAGEVIRKQESIFHARTAQLRHWAVTKRSCLDIDGKPVIVGSNYELTDIRQAELDLRAALEQQTRMRAFLQETFDALPHPLFIKDRKHRYIMTNRAHAAFHNTPRERIIGSTSWDYAVPEVAQSIHEEEERLFNGINHGQAESEYSLVDGNGRIRRNLVRKVLSRDAEGNPVLIGITIDVTELHEAEARQARLREFYQRLFDAIPLPVSVKDTNHVYQLVNKAFCEAHQRSLEETLGKSTWDFNTPEEAQSTIDLDNTLFQQEPGQVMERELPLRYADGLAHEVMLRKVVYEGVDGERLIVSTHTDLSNLRAVERNLRSTLRRLTTLIDNAPLGIALLGVGCRIHGVNPFLVSLLGYHEEELLDREYQGLVIARYRELDEKKKDELRSTGVIQPFETALLAQSGREIPVLVSGVLVHEDPACPMYWVLVVDLTERKLADEALHQSEGRWQFALEGAGDGVWDWHIPSGQLYYSPRCKTMFGYTETDPEPGFDQWLQSVHPADVEAVKQRIQDHLSKRTPVFISEHRERTKSGAYMWVLGRGKVIEYDEQDAPLRMVGTYSDIGPRKQEEEALRRHRDDLRELVEEQTAGLVAAKDAAERANAAKTEFLSNVSHELRTPMHAILSFAQIGEERAERLSPDKLKEYFHRVATSGERLLKLLDELLDISKLEAGRMVMDLSPCSLQTVLDEVANEYEALLSARKIELQRDYEENLPNLSIDAKRIGQVVRNLLSNAIKFTPDGGCITMKLYSGLMNVGRRQSERVEVRSVTLDVMDTGTGIPESELERIFDKFVQSSLNRSAGGTGLGLAICREIVQAHSGQLYARNREGGGTVLVVQLPVARSTELGCAEHPLEQ
ncbi:PAS domain S-box protein [Uliginosibacterium gangwonense]|uniref:PAS domain S-box protein n=1 Tax=Uliginosibacterium gangwonense TaxID=392736 RepID=UPI0003649D57|nr:PAS domain S-box protein [Uliginosibacterium gangwonense]